MFTQDVPAKAIANLNDLNAALMRLNPSISGISVSMLETKGATLAMLNTAIAANNTNLYNGMKRAELLTALKAPLAPMVNTFATTFHYDNHGDKHFPGGPPGTKFAMGKATVNPALETLIGAQLGRIRRDANGQNQSYYYTLGVQPYSGGKNVCIQVDYTAGPPDSITYHGYPDASVVVLVLSRSKGGPAIAT